MEPLVSVIMSTLNTKKEFLEESLKSIVSQSYKNFEWIIIADGGKDDEIISKVKDERIKIIKHENSIGLTCSLNEAIEISKGKYIARMDSDDIALRERLKKQVDFMEANKEIDVCGMFYQEIGKNKKNVCEVFYQPEEVQCKLFFTNVIAHPVAMIRKEFLEKNQIRYNEEYPYSQDFELWTRCSKKGKIAIIPEFGLKYRIHDNQVSTEKKETQSKLYYSVLQRNLSELGMNREDIKYVLMLNGRSEITDRKELKNFLKRVEAKNKEKNLYEKKVLKNILGVYYRIACIKNKKFFLIDSQFIKYIIKKLKIKIILRRQG